MSHLKKIQTALISVYDKENLLQVIKKLQELDVKIFSTGGTQKFIERQSISVHSVEELTGYPSILSGRVKTLHPKVFGGILARSDKDSDEHELRKYEIPSVDLVIVDLYPFEETVRTNPSESELIEQIDIGGISLIRAAAKNFRDVMVVPSKNQYNKLIEVLEKNNGETTLEERKEFACEAFNISSHYDTVIFNYFNKDAGLNVFKQSSLQSDVLRYGENPHQRGVFYGDLEEVFNQIHGKQISYNNLLDIDSAIRLIVDFEPNTFAVIKHNNPCGLASRSFLTDAWKDALAGDPVSAFGGILVANNKVDLQTAQEINKLFFEVIIAPAYDSDALDLLKSKKNRIILEQKRMNLPKQEYRSILNGTLLQDKDIRTEYESDLKTVTDKKPEPEQVKDLLFANKVVKHSKSNAIVLVKNRQLVGIGMGQTSRVDALRQAIEKAKSFGFDLNGAVMASDAFFPFKDSVEIASQSGINAVIQPGGSKRDQESIDFCNENNIAMVFTGVRHFRH
ncbi:MAG: bifunctional phosphoribosylaminoimidazolecarboxamide formyltransferase/IMP cyclohydrolase [Bacteroidales bacterium]